MASGKHSSDEEFDWDSIPIKKILIVFLVLILIAGAAYGVYYGITVYKEKNKPEEAIAPEEKEDGMPETIEGYLVLGQLVIEKLEVEQYILDSAEDEALKNGVSKLYGGNINETGNFCIAGHNYEGVFEKLNELEVGDDFCILDRDENITKYKIVDISEIEPEDLTCLLPNEEVAEVTLITCENEATTRLVVKAEKIVDETENNETANEDGTIENTVDV